MSVGIVGVFVSSVYEPVKTVPPRLILLAATLVALTIELPDRFKLSPTGNSFILLSLTTNGILFAIYYPMLMPLSLLLNLQNLC